MTTDLALVLDEKNDRLILHTATCPAARMAAARGLPVMTMFGCESEPESVKIERHGCLPETDFTIAQP